MTFVTIFVYAAGAFSVVLGVLHFTFPERFGFRAALSSEGPSLAPFRLWFYRYDFKRSGLYEVVRVMNHCVSFTILSVGVYDLLANFWLSTTAGALVAGWIAAFWFVRAATQLYLGRRRGRKKTQCSAAFRLLLSAMTFCSSSRGISS